MTTHLPQVLDASALVALFRGRPAVMDLLDAAHVGRTSLLFPTTCIADAEREVRAGTSGWEAILLTFGVRSLALSEHAAIEIGSWPGRLSARHAVHEAYALRSVVVTCDRTQYAGLRVPLRVV